MLWCLLDCHLCLPLVELIGWCVIIWGKLWFSVVSDYDKHEMLKETEPANSQSSEKKGVGASLDKVPYERGFPQLPFYFPFPSENKCLWYLLDVLKGTKI